MIWSCSHSRQMCLSSTSKRAWWHLCKLCFNLDSRGLHLKHFLIEILQKAEVGSNYVKFTLKKKKKWERKTREEGRTSQSKVGRTGLKLAQMGQSAFYPLSQTFILYVKIMQNAAIVNVRTLCLGHADSSSAETKCIFSWSGSLFSSIISRFCCVYFQHQFNLKDAI